MPLRPDYEVTMILHTLLGVYMKDKEADWILQHLDEVMSDPDGGPELVRLMQKWIAMK